MKYLRNSTESNIVCEGYTFTPNTYELIDPLHYVKIGESSAILTYVASGDLVAARDDTGEADITDINIAVNFLKNLIPCEVDISGIDKTTTEKALKTCPIPMEGSSSIIVSQNFCDKTTWYDGSSRVTGEELSADLTHLIYTSDHTHWIDLSHGKVAYEDKYISTYAPKIYRDGSEITSGFTINYETGIVTFESSQIGHIISADYSYAVDNIWKIVPSSGKILKLLRTYTKISSDVSFDTDMGVIFQIYMTVGGVPDTLVAQTKYKTITDFIVCASRSERIEKWGTMPNDIITLYFDYVTTKELSASSGMYVKIGIFKMDGGNMVFTDGPSGTFGYSVAEVVSLTP